MKIPEGSVLPNGGLVCPRCFRVVRDAKQLDEDVQYNLFGEAVVRTYFACSQCEKKFSITIAESVLNDEPVPVQSQDTTGALNGCSNHDMIA